MNMQTGHITHEHPLDVVYRERVQQEKKLKEQQRAMQGYPQTSAALLAGSSGPNSFLAKHDDPLIKAEIDKNLKEQRKLLEQDFARSIEEIDKNFELKKQEILRQNQVEVEAEKQKWEVYRREEEKKIRAEMEAEIDAQISVYKEKLAQEEERERLQIQKDSD